MEKRQGFTLIEISIVLVIVGLLTAAIVLGKDMIEAAGVRRQVVQISNYETAFTTFRLKYNCRPGDCLNAVSILGTTDQFGNSISNGNGNGEIDTSNRLCYDDALPCGSANWNTSPELHGTIQQLSVAGLIDFTPRTPTANVVGTGVPPVAINKQAGFFIAASYNFTACTFLPCRRPDITPYSRGNNLIWMVGCNVSPNQRLGNWDNYCGVFTASEAMGVDQKLDDGIPLSGKLISFGGAFTNSDCLQGVGTSARYKLSNSTRQCMSAYVVD